MEGEVFFTGDKQTDVHTHGHRDSMTELAQLADSMKMRVIELFLHNQGGLIGKLLQNQFEAVP